MNTGYRIGRGIGAIPGKRRRSKSKNPRNGHGLFALNATTQNLAPDWSVQLGIAVVLRPDRVRIAEAESDMLLMIVHQAVMDAERLSKKLSLMYESNRHSKEHIMHEQATDLVRWLDSTEVMGLRWIADTLLATSGVWIEPEKLAAKLRAMVSVALPKAKPRRRITIASVAGREAVA